MTTAEMSSAEVCTVALTTEGDGTAGQPLRRPGGVALRLAESGVVGICWALDRRAGFFLARACPAVEWGR